MPDHRTVPTHDGKTLIIDHAAVSLAAVARGEAISLGIALDLEGHYNGTRRRGEHTVVIPAEKLGEIIADMAYQGASAHREFIGELEAALRDGQDKLNREGAQR